MTMAAHTKTRPAATKANRKPVALPPKKGVVAKKPAARPAPAKPAKPAARKAPVSKAPAKPAKPAAKKAPVSKAPVKPSKPAAKKAPVVKKAAVSKPAVKVAASKPAPKAQKTVKPAVKAASKPAAKPAQKPAAKPVAKKPQPAVKKAVVTSAKSPGANKAAAPKPASKSGASKPVAPVKAAPAKPSAKPVPAKSPAPATPAPAKQPSKPMEMSRPNPVMTQAAMEAERRKLAKMKESQKKPQPVVSPKINTKSARKYQPEFLKSVLDQPTHSEQSGPMIRYSDADLQEFRELITKKLEDAKRELAYWQGIITHKGEMSGDEADSRYGGMEEGVSSDREYASHMASRTLDFIEKLEKALMRIQNKTYGVCRVTGKLIDKARLRAVPHATLSMEAKLSMSKNPGGQNP
jgi:RNA polymerase-binding transcription factor DksA